MIEEYLSFAISMIFMGMISLWAFSEIRSEPRPKIQTESAIDYIATLNNIIINLLGFMWKHWSPLLWMVPVLLIWYCSSNQILFKQSLDPGGIAIALLISSAFSVGDWTWANLPPKCKNYVFPAMFYGICLPLFNFFIEGIKSSVVMKQPPVVVDVTPIISGEMNVKEFEEKEEEKLYLPPSNEQYEIHGWSPELRVQLQLENTRNESTY